MKLRVRCDHIERGVRCRETAMSHIGTPYGETRLRVSTEAYCKTHRGAYRDVVQVFVEVGNPHITATRT